MNWKKGLTIGLLTITAIGLVGCAVILSKKNQAYKPKVQANAEYEYTSYNYNDKTWYINGTTTQNPYINIDNDIGTATISNYTIQKTTTNIYVVIRPTKILNAYGEEQNLNNYQCSTAFRLNPEKTIDTIQINQDYTSEGETDELGNPLNYEFSYQIILKNTDNTQITQYTYFRIATENLTMEILYSEYRIQLDKIEIATNIATIEQAYQTGFTTGYQNKGDLIDGNFIDIRNMMLSVLTMPFTFINQAFNVTLWEGTPYAFNVGEFIKGLIAIASILFIIKLFTSGFSIIGNYTGDIRARRDTHELRRSQTELNKAKTEKTKNSTTKKE